MPVNVEWIGWLVVVVCFVFVVLYFSSFINTKTGSYPARFSSKNNVGWILQKEAESYLPILMAKDGKSLCMHDLLNAQLWTFKYRCELVNYLALMLGTLSTPNHYIC